MKIIIIENENFTQHRIGGISSYIQAMGRYFDKKQLSYCCIGAGFENTTRSVMKRGTPPLGGRGAEGVKLISISNAGLSNARFFMKLFLAKGKIFKGMEGAVFHFHHPYMALALRSLKRNNKFVLTLHSKQDQSFRGNRNNFFGFFYDRFTRKSLILYDAIIADNGSLSDYYCNKFGIDPNLAIIIPAPVDLEVFKPLNRSALRQKYNLNEADKVVLYAGRIEKEKNLELLIRSCRILMNDVAHAKLWIVGEGSEFKRIQDYSRQQGLPDVSFIKTLPAHELAELMNCADVFALTSLHEGGPIVIKEALACNLPVVSIDVGDVAVVLEGLEGCFVASYDEKEFAGCLKKAIEPGLHSGFRERVEKFGVDEFGEKVVKVYEGCY